MNDVIIIGAGITGTAIARELSKYEMKVTVLEKENDVGNGATLANSAIIHSGHDPKEGTLKAKLNVLGNALYDELEKELKIPLIHTGAYLVAHDDEQVETLEILKKRADANGVPHEEVPLEEAFKNEPNISKNVIKVLSLPTTKVTFPWEVAVILMENAIKNGVTLERNQAVMAIHQKEGYFEVETETDVFETKMIINAAGVYADTIASMVETNVPYKVIPRKGEYFVIDRREKGYMNKVIYPVPSSKGKGVLVTPQVHGELLIGPNSLVIDDKDGNTTTAEGLAYIKEHAKEIADHIPYDKTIRTFAGIRPSIDQYDFYLDESHEVPGFYHCGGIDSPGLTSAPAIALQVTDWVLSKEPYAKKETFIASRDIIKPFRSMSDAEKKEAFLNDHSHGRLICKCELVTEGDVLNAIRRPIPADSVKAVKKRTRAGAGICQGGYCEHNVIDLIARELQIPKTEVNYYAKDTHILVRQTKEVE